MNTIERRIKASLSLLLIAGLLVGCGTSGDNGPITERPTEEEVQQPATTVPAAPLRDKEGKLESRLMMKSLSTNEMSVAGGVARQNDAMDQDWNTESYDVINENQFLAPAHNPLSTFSIDVDAASYSNVRRFVTASQKPPKDAVRIEELVNYFTYDYPQPSGERPFSITTEISECPWNPKHKLALIGLQGKKIEKKSLPPSNIVFLIDVSGSMESPQKLPLLKQSFRLLVNELRSEDRVAIVVYAGAAGLVLPSTAGDEKTRILGAIDQLNAGGSTAGGEGIKLAYKVAKENFMRNGNNRVILATDGDFNIGPSSDAEMVRLIEEKREDGIFLTVLGFGMGNYKDSKMEKLADKGNGNYAYIDDILEAKKTLVSEFGATLFTIAKDVKIQVEFNPSKVAAYRLIGYENRLLNKEDFNDDKKDAGELGAGHTVTAMYEIIPAGVESPYIKSVDDLKYQKTAPDANKSNSDEMMTVKLRYKEPSGSVSKLIEVPVKDKHIKLSNASENLRFASAVAAFGMLLRSSEFIGSFGFEDAIKQAKSAKGGDESGYRHDFVKMAERCQLLFAGS